MDDRGGSEQGFLDVDREGRGRVPGSTAPAIASVTAAAAGGDSESIGERVRRFRVAAGLSQSQLAAGRFSKEYVSQIERGKTKPTEETLVWLADRLGADPDLLRTGVAALDRARLETVLVRAEALGVEHRHDEAIVEFSGVRAAAAPLGASDLTLRALAGEAWSRMELGDVSGAIELLLEARGIAESPRFTDVERADVLFRLGVCRYKLSSIQTATALFDEALALAERSSLPCDLLRADILGWRSRCYRRRRDHLAAREDVERALELADALRDPRTAANVLFQASLVAEREGHLGLARSYAERARAHYAHLSDLENVGRLLNNLGTLEYQLGRPEDAVERFKEALRLLLDEGSDTDAAHVICSLAEVHLGTRRFEEAESEARKAIDMLAGRDDYVYELGKAQVVLGRALTELDRLDEAQEILRAADRSFEQFASASHRAAAWLAMGDLATRRGNDREAARQYRRAAEALQDVRF